MTYRTMILAAAITAVATLGTIGSASAGKEQWERNKPHVNVGMIGHVNKRKVTLNYQQQVRKSKVAITIPAYQSYTVRAKVQEGIH